ncbi:MAG: alpha/beta hydrolase [Patescibacteria group bacterium]
MSNNLFNLEKIPHIEPNKKTESKEYDLESGITVTVNYREINPKDKDKENIDHNGAVILLPGWEAETKDKTTIALSQQFSNSSQELTYIITADSKKNAAQSTENDMLYEEATAISKFIKETGSKEIKLVGYSIGGDRAINIAQILQTDPEIKIQGLILLAPLGLYEQSPKELTSHLINDSFVNTPKNLLKNKDKISNFAQWVKVAADVNLNTAKKTILSPGHICQLKRRITEASHSNPRAADLKVPIVLINGADDSVSSKEEIAPIKEGAENNIRLREQYLKNNVFKQSPYVRMIVPSREANHGLPFFRSKSVADASLYLLDRFNREK